MAVAMSPIRPVATECAAIGLCRPEEAAEGGGQDPVPPCATSDHPSGGEEERHKGLESSPDLDGEVAAPHVHRASLKGSPHRRISVASTTGGEESEVAAGHMKSISPVGSLCTMSTRLSSEADNRFAGEDADDAASVATSSAGWQTPGSVLICVDWDDTICPTTWFMSKPKFMAWFDGACGLEDVLDEGDRALLQDLDWAARGFLIAASRWGKVCCVTLATRSWHARTLASLLPRVAAAWEELSLELRCAAEEVAETRRERQALAGPTWCLAAAPGDKLERQVFESRVHVVKKQRAMSKALRHFYGRGHSWKNVISIGDGVAERCALQDIGFARQNPESSRTGAPKQFRVKTVKFFEAPDCAQLSQELQQMQAWLPPMVALDRDFDMALDADEEELQRAQQCLQDIAEQQAC